MRAATMLTMLFLPSITATCTWPDWKGKVKYGYQFCCNMDGTVPQPVDATFKSPVGDTYSFRVGIFHDPDADCGGEPDKWFPQEDYSDAFEHTSSNSYSANYAKERDVAQLYCHNAWYDCNLEMVSLTIGSKDASVGVGTMAFTKPVNVSHAE